jgi:hypothetical protein
MLCTVGRFVLSSRIPTVFDIIPLELFRFRNSRYSVTSCSFSCSVCPLLFSFSYSNVKVKNGRGVLHSIPSVFMLRYGKQFGSPMTQHIGSSAVRLGTLQARDTGSSMFCIIITLLIIKLLD